MKKRWMKILSVGLCVAMVAGTVFVGESQNMLTVYADDSKSTALQNVITDSAGVETANSSTDGKDETVYVIGDANGNNSDVIVSDWLKNGSSANTITDKTDLTDVTNVKGYEDFTKGKDGSITWNADGSDIYYQGKTDKELPVTVKVSYKLDGKDIAPADLAGKSGKVEIHFDYINNTKETAQLDGADTDIQVPFTMMTGVVLPTDTFTNVEIDHGKLISEGNNTVAVGYAFPGLKDSLNIDKYKDEIKEDTESDDSASEDSTDDTEDKVKDLDIPDSITISADAVNFALDMTMTVALPDALSDLDFTNVDTSKIKDDMDELADNSKKLVDGTADLDKGAGDLQDGTGKLKNGTKDLKKGTNDLVKGVNDLQTGTNNLQSGACQLNSGANELASGAGKIAAGAGSLHDGTSTLASSSKTLDSGAGDLQTGAKQLADGTNTAVTGSAALYAGAVSLSSGLKTAAAGTAGLLDVYEEPQTNSGMTFSSLNGINSDMATKSKLLATEVATIYGTTLKLKYMYGKDSISFNNPVVPNVGSTGSASQDTAVSDLQNEKASAQAVIDSANGDPSSLSGDSLAEYYKAEGTLAVIDEALSAIQANSENNNSYSDIINQQNDVINQQNTELQEVYGNINSSTITIMDALNTASKNAVGVATDAAIADGYINKMYSGTKKIDTGLKKAVSGSNALASGLSSLQSGSKTLNDGAQKLYKGTTSLKTGTSALVTGTSTLDSGASTLATGASDLYSGASTLANGTSTLANGTITLSNGVNTLKTGSVSLNDGAGKLDDGVDDLVEGVNTLTDGTGDLAEGMKKFDKEGIQKLKKIFGDDVDDVLNRLDVVKDAGSAYTNFAGAADNTDSSVKFIYKTAEIK